jgi:hypothetical protein
VSPSSFIVKRYPVLAIENGKCYLADFLAFLRSGSSVYFDNQDGKADYCLYYLEFSDNKDEAP